MPAIVYKNNSAYSFDQSTFDILQWVKSQSQLFVSTDYDVFSSSSHETAWFGFRIDSIMSPLVAFVAARNSTQLPLESLSEEKIVYDIELINEEFAWRKNESKFIAPIDGVYIFSHNTPAKSFQEFSWHLMVNYEGTHHMCLCETEHNGIESIGGSVAVTLQSDDVVEFYRRSRDHYPYGDSNLSMYIQGFLYNPISGRQIIWFLTTETGHITGPKPNFIYDKVNINIGKAWNSQTNDVTIPVSGIYYIGLTSFMCGSLWSGNEKLEIKTLLNNVAIIVLKLPGNVKSCISRSQAVLYSLKIGDKLWVSIPIQTRGGYHCNENGEQSFMGYLLY